MILLVVLSVCLAVAVAWAYLGASPGALRPAVLVAALGLGVWIAATTEALAALGWIGRVPFVVAWSALCGGLASVLVWRVRHHPPVEWQWPELQPFERAFAVGLIVFAAAEAVIGLIAPPNTWDSLTYHMSRVMHWIQNGNVNLYATHILRQNHLAPWTDYALLHTVVLGGSDRYVNLVQWAGMLGSLAALTMIARELGATRAAQGLAAAFAISIPMGVLQSTGTKSGHTLSLWLGCMVFFLIRLSRRPTTGNAVAVGLALGLGMLTKATMLLFAPPFLCLWTWRRWVRGEAGDRATWCRHAAVILARLSLFAGSRAKNISKLVF
ncbi:MAG: glycosyltransferase family 39 protein [Verrucomicrobia bacterium]|nr:glycosyltransferase family 39 protein [Verrucomicrobiota bacterium]MDA1087810.1 glycosyltransferase family 39 protein [Verrucomicrobiota bacterium]